MRVGVIGCGFVGLISSIGLASKGVSVTAVDIDSSRIEKISRGEVPFHEPGVEKLLKICLQSGTLKVSTSMQDIEDCEIVFICVQTPPTANGSIDLQILETAVRKLALIFAGNKKRRIVVVRSTVVPGTTENFVAPIFQEAGGKSRQTEIAFNPEFLREGSALEDFLHPDRIVIGTNSKKTAKILTGLYRFFKAPIILTSSQTAELSKYTSNVFLATLVSFSNEIAAICERTPGTDVEDVLNIIHKDRRFIPSKNIQSKIGILSYLKAGCGFGGSCLPKDLSALISYGDLLGLDVSLLKAVESVNKKQTRKIVDMAEAILGTVKDQSIAVLGAAFKGGTDDLRDSPGLRIAGELCKRRAKVTIYDPLVDVEYLKNYVNKGVIIASSFSEFRKGIKLCIIASNAPEFYSLRLWEKDPILKRIKIIDGRRILKVPKDKKAVYYAVGRPGIYNA